MDVDAERIEELKKIVAGVKARVRARYVNSDGGEQPAYAPPADLMPLVHARDAAQAKVAAIGSVNPRAGGPLNQVIQSVKRMIARSLGWFVREQVVFNREVLAALEATLEALNEHNRAIGAWDHKLTTAEVKLLRNVADLNGAFQYRATQAEVTFREMLASQHANFTSALDRTGTDIQKRLWADMESLRSQHERIINTELRLIRQRLARLTAEPPSGAELQPASAVPAAAAPAFDYARFAERFRGSEESVRKSQEFYRPWFEGREHVLDIGCGRGEFLEMMRDIGIRATGIDLSQESVALCQAKGLDARVADLFPYLAEAPDGEFDGIFCSQVVEHIEPAVLPRMVSLCAAKLARGGVLAIETPNPECLAIFATFFYLDPTHVRPVPSQLLDFYMTEAGLSEIQTHPLSPAEEMFPEIAELPEGVRKRFFGALDYAIIGRKL